ncbi:MAG: hypothetical protein F6K11_17505 [Leptolyngbya sp. SIO3F4]|nr:hypothetical protein [Leptolyngbya sp. SIO3F4]
MFFLDRVSHRWLVPAIASSGLCLMAQTPSQALQFNFSYEEGTPFEQMVGFQVAGDWWASHITDDVTLNIHVGISNSLPENVVGGALPGMQALKSYGDYYSKLNHDLSMFMANNNLTMPMNNPDFEALSGLQGHEDQNGYYYKGQLEQNIWKIYQTSLTNANAKAIDMVSSNSETLDGMIMMNDLTNSKYSWDYNFDRSNDIDKKSLDFLSVAVHEIGHVLGFVSAFDTVEKKEQKATEQENIDRVKRTTSLDLFRYSEQTGNDVVELRAGKASYFSVDRGYTNIADFSRGNNNIGNGSDGYQASHWKHQKKGALGIMGPAIRLGERRDLEVLDLRAMDAIGWDLQNNSNNFCTSSSSGDFLNSSFYNSDSCTEDEGITVDLSLLQQNAEALLAEKLGESVSWLNDNKSIAAKLLTSNQNDLLAEMIANSTEYYQLFDPGSGGWWQILNDLGYGGWWQEYAANDAYGQKAYFSTLEEAEATDVPEPSSLIGLLSFITFGLLGQRSISKPQS